MARTISNSDDVIDSREVIERIEELRSERDDLATAVREAEEALNSESDESAQEPLVGALAEASQALEDWESEFEDELRALESLAKEAEGYAADWKYGEALIRDSYFEDYVRELLEDCGDIPKNIPHYVAIDWTTTADNVRVDYTSVDFDGVTYWIR